MNKLIQGDNLEVLKGFADNSVDAIITDSPYGLGKEPDAVKCLQDWIDHGYHDIKGKGFMGKTWDAFVPQPVLWKECYRVLKPGGHLLSFFGTRTYDWGTLAIRLAGFEIRDCIFWTYGSGFPKSLDISKAIDKAAGAKRKVVGVSSVTGKRKSSSMDDKAGKENRTFSNVELIENNITEPSTDNAKKWNGYGTALKPAVEPVCVARKPLEGTVVDNVLKYGTGGINIDAGRVDTEEITGWGGKAGFTKTVLNGGLDNDSEARPVQGRWPANLIHDGSEEVTGLFPNNSDRFFYCAKTSPAERAGRKHPTVKPLALMEYLVKIYCPEGAVCLDPFAGSGTTAIACINTGRKYICIEGDPDNYQEAKQFIHSHEWGGL